MTPDVQALADAISRFAGDYPAAAIGLVLVAIAALMALLFLRELLGDR